MLDLVQLEIARLDESQHASGSSNDNVRSVVLQHVLVGLDGQTSVDDFDLHVGHVLLETSKLVVDLIGQLARVAHDNRVDFSIDRLNLLQSGNHEHGSLTHSGLGLADDVGS